MTTMSQTWSNYTGEIKGVRFEGQHENHGHQVDDPTSVKPPYYPPAEKEFISAMQTIALRFGKLADNDGNGIWVGYVDKKDNDNYSKGIYCEHCAHYESEKVCKIIKPSIEPGGYCRLAAIPTEYVDIKGKK